MKLIKKIFKKIYFRFILRSIFASRNALIYFYARIFIFFGVRGLDLPFYSKVKNKMNSTAIASFERQKIIFKIKAERYSLKNGPLWLRKYSEKIYILFQKNKFILSIFFKFVSAFLCITIPILIFILLRGTLPVPERVPYGQVLKKLPHESFLRTEWPYTEGPFKPSLSEYEEKNLINIIDPEYSRNVHLTPVTEPNAPVGLTHFGIGYYPTKLNAMRGFLIDEKNTFTVKMANELVPFALSVRSPQENNSTKKLRISYYLFPTIEGQSIHCEINFYNENGENIGTLNQQTPEITDSFSKYSIKNSWRKIFTPNVIPDYGNIGELKLNIKNLPQKILIKTREISQEKNIHKERIESPSQLYLNLENNYLAQNKNLKIHNSTFSKCLFALSDFSYEHSSTKKLKRRGIILIDISGLNADTAYDKEIMNNIQNWGSNKKLIFTEHRSASNETLPSIISLLSSHYAREIDWTRINHLNTGDKKKDFYSQQIPLLPNLIQKLGYRVGAIGSISQFTEATQNGIDLGFHNAIISEQSGYEERQITELASQWLEKYGQSPFFLFLNYDSFYRPFKPPFEQINLTKLFIKPLGLNQKQVLYHGLAAYVDKEMKCLQRKLHELGIEDDVDIIFTSDHGMQLSKQKWGYLAGVPNGLTGAYASSGHSLLDEELRVPLVIKIAHEKLSEDLFIKKSTSHIDLFPTIYSLAGGDTKNLRLNGINFSENLFASSTYHEFETKLNNRHSLYFDSDKYAGILYWGEETNYKPIKYIKQFSPDSAKLFLNHSPWVKNIDWFQSEIFTKLDFTTHKEHWVSNLKSMSLKTMRKVYFQNSPSHKILKISPLFQGNFELTISFEKNFSLNTFPIIRNKPNAMNVKISNEGSGLTYYLSGPVTFDDAIEFDMNQLKITNIQFEKSITPVACPAGIKFTHEALLNTIQSNTCIYFPPPEEMIELNYSQEDKPVILQMSLLGDQEQKLNLYKTDETLKNALKQ